MITQALTESPGRLGKLVVVGFSVRSTSKCFYFLLFLIYSEGGVVIPRVAAAPPPSPLLVPPNRHTFYFL